MGVPVREVLRRHTARELAEWMAYEAAYGPIGSTYANELLAQINELLQNIAYMTGAQLEENPIPMPRQVQRAGFMLEPPTQD